MAADPSSRALRLAGVDIGTLTCRLLAARVAGGRVVEHLWAERRLLRLGEGVQRERRLQRPAIARVIQTLKEWRDRLARQPLDGEIAVATSAVRDAGNRAEFLREVKEETGFSVEVLSGEEEARRTLMGIRSGLPPGVGRILGVDIGGGSTEFIFDVLGQPPLLRSIDLGVVRLTEATLSGELPTDADVQSAIETIEVALRPARAGLGDVTGATLVGTAGTITTLAAMTQRLPAYEPARVHNYRLGLQQVRMLERELRRLSRSERRSWPGLESGREDVILAGTLIVRVVMESFGYAECLVSDLGLREGIVLDLAARLTGPKS